MGNNKTGSRRSFLKTAFVAGSVLGYETSTSHAGSDRSRENAPATVKPKVVVSGYRYDRVEALMDGRVPIEGCELEFQLGRIGDLNTHVFSGPRTLDVTEVGLLPFILARANQDFEHYSLIPVFPLRVFRHKSIFIRLDRGISSAKDLRGKKIATPGYSSTSLTWIRGILQEEFGVHPGEIQWVVSSKDSSAKVTGGASKQENVLPKDISIRTGPTGKDESDLLVDGDVDALLHAAEPRAFLQGHPNVGRLFDDFRSVERDYFAKTGIFPIMHAVAVRNDSIRQHPGLPTAVFNAYSKSKQLMYEEIRRKAWYTSSLPWIAKEAEETRELMGENFWPYGIETNRKALESLLRFSFEQGLAKRKLEIEDLFHVSTLELKESSN